MPDFQVFKAKLDACKEVAVKFLAGRDLPTMKQFATEVDMMRACRNENITSFLGAWLMQARPRPASRDPLVQQNHAFPVKELTAED